ncbi:glycine oxidase [Palleronia marisminoris]|uniref:Bifunctional tRNA (Mnm(5)s(2)U34)-methyltransferase/FAD-dependent cmnm(5)s(2)U34 oxidoreductase n=1 Tax=Palleronia marisminoris TaxID=315423 RepID=A0A1Y5SGH6_9RHOB|nr:FAD-dependent oxidoreductase [Palleronia marisminoris]SFG72767.1 glycine oxidase [Palleronia marisminoris]SLN37185.1 bifunctional tRNA (mnm(5)s(2)U34)-methyltransferase/FAD-dependent cmnm(5)s(2)U34 oxidoreductase [Palleronia marisminoris]
MRATVLGAGVAGLCVATELVARGCEVTVFDPSPRPGPHGCSWWAGGMLAPFCEGETAEEPVVRLGQEAADWWERQGVNVERRGTVVVTLGRDRNELDRFARRVQGHERLDAAALAALEPDLSGRFDRALHVPGEAYLDPRAALEHLRDRLEHSGATFVAEPGPTTGVTFDCRGLAARDALRDLRGVKGEMAVLRSADIHLTRPVRLLHPRFPLYVVPRPGGLFMLGATQIESDDRRRSVRSVLELLSAAYALHPAFGEAELVEIGADARPAFPDNLPRLVRRGETIHVNGLFRHGFLLAPALARMAAEAACDGTRPELYHEDHD